MKKQTTKNIAQLFVAALFLSGVGMTSMPAHGEDYYWDLWPDQNLVYTENSEIVTVEDIGGGKDITYEKKYLDFVDANGMGNTLGDTSDNEYTYYDEEADSYVSLYYDDIVATEIEEVKDEIMLHNPTMSEEDANEMAHNFVITDNNQVDSDGYVNMVKDATNVVPEYSEEEVAGLYDDLSDDQKSYFDTLDSDQQKTFLSMSDVDKNDLMSIDPADQSEYLDNYGYNTYLEDANNLAAGEMSEDEKNALVNSLSSDQKAYYDELTENQQEAYLLLETDEKDVYKNLSSDIERDAYLNMDEEQRQYLENLPADQQLTYAGLSDSARDSFEEMSEEEKKAYTDNLQTMADEYGYADVEGLMTALDDGDFGDLTEAVRDDLEESFEDVSEDITKQAENEAKDKLYAQLDEVEKQAMDSALGQISGVVSSFGGQGGASLSIGTEHIYWLIDDFLMGIIKPDLKLMIEPITRVPLHMAAVIGGLFDGKNQMASLLTLQKLKAQAHKDYQPGTAMCQLGTNVRSLASIDGEVRKNSFILGQRALDRHLGNYTANAAEGKGGEDKGRLQQFKDKYCNANDNNRIASSGDTGLTLMCGTAAEGLNEDIDYARTIGLSQAVDLEAAMAMSSNLYGYTTFTRPSSYWMADKGHQERYLDMRAVLAKRSVAEYSFQKIAAMKAPASPAAIGAKPYMEKIWDEIAVLTADEKAELEKMSYMAQMELLTKRMYQRPGFYTNLYDKPVNVRRVSVALRGLGLMLDRDIYESYLRSEMLMSVLLEVKTARKQQDVQNTLLTMQGSE